VRFLAVVPTVVPLLHRLAATDLIICERLVTTMFLEPTARAVAFWFGQYLGKIGSDSKTPYK
jgi:hypothetical protein